MRTKWIIAIISLIAIINGLGCDSGSDSTIVALEAEIAGLKDQNSILQTEIDEVRGENKSLQNQLSDLMSAKTEEPILQYQGQIESIDQIYDGDTLSNIEVKIADFSNRGEVWPNIFITDEGIFIKSSLRLANIDTPERRPRKKRSDGTIRSQSSLDREKALANEARQYLADQLLSANGRFIVKRPQMGKYAGRMICEIWIKNPDGTLVNVSQILLDAQLAKPYEGGKRPSWE